MKENLYYCQCLLFLVNTMFCINNTIIYCDYGVVCVAKKLKCYVLNDNNS